MLSAAGKNSAAARLHDMDRFDGQVCWTSERTGGAYYCGFLITHSLPN